ncbi:DUF2218 domain-containing protein [Skermania sp. ID1734]|uniref:DUF2218 domain-containing protein n=1 Tax=Skermania sp. ID1734 TaxID=2597516 RepID=UPI00163D8C63|nr:DUF2218 domain-containing protein [Skermania sp. ID1734]
MAGRAHQEVTAVAILEAQVQTDRPRRYLTQFCKHAAAMGGSRGHRFRAHSGTAVTRGEIRLDASRTDTTGTVTFDPWGRCDLEADDTALRIRIEADDQAALHRIRDIVDNDIRRFSRDELRLEWHPVDTKNPTRANETRP